MSFLKSTKGGPIGSAGGRILEGEAYASHHPPPKSAPWFLLMRAELRKNQLENLPYERKSGVKLWSSICLFIFYFLWIPAGRGSFLFEINL